MECEQEVLRLLLVHGGRLDEKRLLNIVSEWTTADWVEALTRLEQMGIVARRDDVTILLENPITTPIIDRISEEVKTDY